jgi:hypothetical protein
MQQIHHPLGGLTLIRLGLTPPMAVLAEPARGE